MDVRDLFLACAAQATTIVKRVGDDMFARPTPDTEWTVHDLAAHMLYELSWTPEIVQGKTMEEVGSKFEGELFADTQAGLSAAWDTAKNRVKQTVPLANPAATVHLSYGETTTEHYLREAASDQLIHAWDLGEAIGMPVQFDEVVAREIFEYAFRNAEGMERSGLFAPPRPVAADADVQTRLLALFGRDRHWRERF